MKTLPFEWSGNTFKALDQRYLPHEEIWVDCITIEDFHAAIKDMVVRGAPLIGFTALFGLVLWAKKTNERSIESLKKVIDYIKTARHTAVNLAYEADRFYLAFKSSLEKVGWDNSVEKLENFTIEQFNKLDGDNLKMAKLAEEELIKIHGHKKYRLVTLCNTGALACGPRGTAFGVIDYLHQNGKIDHVFAAETRPYLQGSRLTAYELKKSGVPYSVFVEGAMFHLLQTQNIDGIFIGADRIVENGDTANKIGSATLSQIAKRFNVPFFVVAPTSSFDLSLKRGEEIEIEFRPESEVLEVKGHKIAPHNSKAYNPSFDVTPGENIKAIFCENGTISPVNSDNVKKIVGIK
ncbi:MAG: S-methyl-5-thioribose-1-phosphate isomerase [Bdellovibrio sp.]